MSRYEWEHGEIKIPSKAWGKLKRDFREEAKKLANQEYETALRVHERLMEMAKGKRKPDWDKLLREATTERRVQGRGGFTWTTEVDIDPQGGIARSMGFVQRFDWELQQGKRRPTKPKKKDFPAPKATDKTFQAGEAHIAFNDKSRTVTWFVPENNHACDHAREHPLAKVLFKLLGKVTWTRGSGGTIVGNDEYNSDSVDLGGGGNYEKGRWGPECNRQWEPYGLRY